MMTVPARFFALFVALGLLPPTGLHAQVEGEQRPTGVNVSSIALDRGDPSALASEDADQRSRVAAFSDYNALERMRGLSAMGSAAWPTIRSYLWETCFEGYDLFAGYAVSRPGHEVADVLTFLVMIDKEVWNAAEPEARQTTLLKVEDAFTARLAELGLHGTLEIILVGR